MRQKINGEKGQKLLFLDDLKFFKHHTYKKKFKIFGDVFQKQSVVQKQKYTCTVGQNVLIR